MVDSDSDKEKVVEKEVIPPFKIRTQDMDIKLVKEVVKYADELFKKYSLEKDVAVNLVNLVKQNKDFKIGDGQWQCIIGQNFGCSLSFDAHVLIFFDLLTVRKSILLFKSG